MKHPDLQRWKEKWGTDLELGTEVSISPNCQFYERSYDHGMKARVVTMGIEGPEIGRITIGISDAVPINDEMGFRCLCETDGYSTEDLMPALVLMPAHHPL